MRVVVSLVLLLALSSTLQAEEPVYFADPILKAAVEAELWISDPTPTDMLELTSLYISVTDQPIGSLAGLEYARNLEELSATFNEISDISVLSGLGYLRVLVLNNNVISDMSVLSNLTNLEHVDLHHNFISDISALSRLSNLRTFIFRGNDVADVSALSGLSTLKKVDLNGNQISDISLLSGLTGLDYLDLRGNPLNGEACSVFLPQLIAANPHARILPSACLFHLSLSAGTGGSVTSPGEGDFTYAYNQWLTLEAKADPSFVFAGWIGVNPAMQNPLILIPEGDVAIRAAFVSVLDMLHVDDDAADDPAPGDPGASDPQENGTAEHPFDSIQEAIEVAANGAVVFVHGGTYHEHIDLLGKRITLTGFDPNDSKKAAWPVIDGGGDIGPIVSFTHGEDPNCVLRGFVITGGKSTSVAAIQCSASSPTVANCLIVGNCATDTQSAVVHCADSNAVFVNCTIADNYVAQDGVALRLQNSLVLVRNSILWRNTPAPIVAVDAGRPSIRYTRIRGGWPGPGNIADNPLFASVGRWADGLDPNLAVPADHPDAVWTGADYHVQSQAGRWDPEADAWVQDAATSPCIDAGDPASPVGDEPSPNGGVINLGAYGGTAEAALGEHPGAVTSSFGSTAPYVIASEVKRSPTPGVEIVSSLRSSQ